jgi:hypothetical protein
MTLAQNCKDLVSVGGVFNVKFISKFKSYFLFYYLKVISTKVQSAKMHKLNKVKNKKEEGKRRK